MKYQCAHCPNVIDYTPATLSHVLEGRTEVEAKPEKKAPTLITIKCPKCSKSTTISA